MAPERILAIEGRSELEVSARGPRDVPRNHPNSSGRLSGTANFCLPKAASELKLRDEDLSHKEPSDPGVTVRGQ